MLEELNRHELPIQSVYERGEDCTTTVPVHLEVMALSPESRIDLSLLAWGRDTIRSWYDEDMAYYLEVLNRAGRDLPWLKSYERFDDAWEFRGLSDDKGFLRLDWRNNGSVYSMGFCPVPITIYNQHDGSGKFYGPEHVKAGGGVETIQRPLVHPDVVYMPPEKMRKYGVETDTITVREDEGIAEVVAHAFCSDYHENVAKNLLLRNMAVYYLNKLLEVAREK